jgi:hypothetical protein
MKTKLSLLFVLFFSFGLNQLIAAEKYTISGYVYEKGSGEALIGASVAIPTLGLGAVTNA